MMNISAELQLQVVEAAIGLTGVTGGTEVNAGGVDGQEVEDHRTVAQIEAAQGEMPEALA